MSEFIRDRRLVKAEKVQYFEELSMMGPNQGIVRRIRKETETLTYFPENASTPHNPTITTTVEYL